MNGKELLVMGSDGMASGVSQRRAVAVLWGKWERTLGAGGCGQRQEPKKKRREEKCKRE